MQVGNRLAMAGLYTLVLALSRAVLLALDDPIGRTPAVVLACLVLTSMVGLWIIYARRLKDRRREHAS